MSGHTPGPWHVDPRSPDTVLDVMPDGDEDNGAILIADCAHTENACANARLIAAAPDLLAELRMIADVLHTKVGAREIPGESVFQIVNGIDRAIAKATGSQVPA